MKNIPVSLLLLSLSHALSAADYLVTRVDDPSTTQGCTVIGGCGLSLRQAVMAANKRPGPDRILLARKTYELKRASASFSADGSSGPLRVTDALEVIGDGPTRTRVRWASGTLLPHQTLPHQHAVWEADRADFKLSQLAVSDGRGPAGGCIRLIQSPATFTDVLIEHCLGSFGGAIHISSSFMSYAPTVALNRVNITANQAEYGGAIYITPGGTIVANDVDITQNTANIAGGGLYGSYRFTISPEQLNLIWRSEGAGSRFTGNTAGHGGAVAAGDGDANFFALSGAIPLVFDSNRALVEGGAVHMSKGRLTLENALLLGNSAPVGGAVALRGNDALISGVAFESNQSVTGVGGAIAANIGYGSNSVHGNVEIRQSSFNFNQSQQNGGAIANNCQALTVRDSSFNDNRVATGQGEVIATTGATFFAHVTTANHGAVNSSGPSTLYKSFNTACGTQSFAIANSLIGGFDICYSQAGTIMSQGGNQYGPNTGNCFFIPNLDQYGTPSSFGLSFANFGSSQTVLGWNNDGLIRTQVNFGVATYCSTHDVRGLPRADGACDTGAFEQ